MLAWNRLRNRGMTYAAQVGGGLEALKMKINATMTDATRHTGRSECYSRSSATPAFGKISFPHLQPDRVNSLTGGYVFRTPFRCGIKGSNLCYIESGLRPTVLRQCLLTSPRSGSVFLINLYVPATLNLILTLARELLLASTVWKRNTNLLPRNYFAVLGLHR